MTPKLALQDVVVSREGREILRIDALDVLPAEVLAILGPNGAGKTTLLCVMALLERPSQGDVLFEDATARGRELELRRRMAVVFQEPLLLNRTVEANVALGLALRGVPRRQQRERARRWMDRFGIAALADRRALTLSGGEAQRASLARAFALEPEVLLLDEPLRALDQPTREALIDDLDDVLRETRTTTVLVTHDREEAARLGKRTAILVDGGLRQMGPTADVFRAPADEVVAAYVGISAVVPVRVTRVDAGRAIVEAGGARFEINDEAAREGDALLCVRPEDVALESARAEGSHRLLGVVRRIRGEGGTVHVDVDCGFRLVAAISKSKLSELALSEGASVSVFVPPNAVHLIFKRLKRSC